MTPGHPRVSILILTHNAPRMVLNTLWTLRRTRGVSHEVIVVDNASRRPLRLLLRALALVGGIQVLRLLDHNRFFAAGNNLAATLVSPACSHLLLLNSDVEIRDPAWLRRLLAIHRRGISAYGVLRTGPLPRVDGYCLLIDRDLYETHGLDERFPWWWSVTRLQSHVLTAGHNVRGVEHHEAQLHHVGGASGGAHLAALGDPVTPDEVRAWFGGRTVEILDTLEGAG